jgi:acyl-CoA reductase-like NAD-dependent aldehyde dehydrogenase
MLQIVQAYDRSPIAQVATDDAGELEAKLNLAVRAFRDCDHWLQPYERIEILSRLASLMDAERDRLSCLIAVSRGAGRENRPRSCSDPTGGREC